MSTMLSEADVRRDIERKLHALVDNARVSPTNTAFMRSVIAGIVETLIAGAADTERLRYLANDKENWRALYDLTESREGTFAEGDNPLDDLRGMIDEFAAIDATDAEVG